MSDEPLEHSCMNPTACLTCLSKGRLIPGPMEVIEKGAFKEQSDVPVFKHNKAGEVLGKAHVNPDGTVDIELNDAGAALFSRPDDLSMYSIHTPVQNRNGWVCVNEVHYGLPCNKCTPHSVCAGYNATMISQNNKKEGTSMREYAVVSINRGFSPEYFVMFMDEEDIMWTSHSGPFDDPGTANEIADALTIKARSDAGTL